jgi:hypothetical protein
MQWLIDKLIAIGDQKELSIKVEVLFFVIFWAFIRIEQTHKLIILEKQLLKFMLRLLGQPYLIN